MAESVYEGFVGGEDGDVGVEVGRLDHLVGWRFFPVGPPSASGRPYAGIVAVGHTGGALADHVERPLWNA